MASFKSFEDTPVWKVAAKFAASLLPWTADNNAFRGTGDMANQIQRATLSISNNIAEGFDRGSNKELIHFLYVAKGSNSEVRSMLKVMLLMDAFDDQELEIESYIRTTTDISKQLGGWINSLKNSKIKGQKFLNDETKSDYQRDMGRERAMARLAESRDKLEAKILREVEERNEAMEEGEE